MQHTSPRYKGRFRLQIQLGLAFGLLCIILAAGLALALTGLTWLRGGIREAIEVTGGRSRTAAEVALTTLQCRRYEKDIFLNLDDPALRGQYLAKWQAAFQDLQQVIERSDALATTPAQREQAAVWRQASEEYERAVLGVEQAIAAGRLTTPTAANAALAPYKEPIRILTETASAQAAQEDQLLLQANARLMGLSEQFLWMLLGAGLLALLIAVGWSLYFPYRLLRPIHALQRATDQLALGRLEVRADVARADELGMLAGSFNRMADQLRQQIDALDQRDLVQRQNEQLVALLELVRDLETPTIPLLDGVLLVPIVGNLDERRISLFHQRVLEAVYSRQARTVILDLTGLAVIDNQVAQAIDRFIVAMQLIGARTIVSGIRSELAQTATSLGLAFGGAQVVARVQEALGVALGNPVYAGRG